MSFFHSLISGGQGYSEEYQAVLDYATSQGYTLPTLQQRRKENAKLVAMKTNGIWDERDVIYNIATNGDLNFACINWKNPGTHQALPSALTPYFIRKRGIQGDGSAAMYLDSQFIPATHGVNYTQNDCSLAVGVLNELSDSTDVDFGASDASLADRTVFVSRSGTNVAYAISASTARTFANASSIGRYLLQRRASNDARLFKDGSQFDSVTTASTGVPNVSIAILAENQNGTFANYSAHILSHFDAGSSLSGLESVKDTIESDYMDSIAEEDPDEIKILFEGDSITLGTGTTKGLSYPLRTFVNLDHALAYSNIGIGGQTSAQMLARVSVYSDYIDSNGIFVLFAGTNDVLNSVATATTWQNIQDIITAVKALGVTKIAVGTLMDVSTYTAAQDTLRADLNTLIVNNAGSIGYEVMDFSATAELGTHSGTYFADSAHPNNSGAAVMATVASTAIANLL